MSLSPKEAEELSRDLQRERELLPQLAKLGVSADELRVLQGDEELLKILLEQGPDAELALVLAWHKARLERVTAEARK